MHYVFVNKNFVKPCQPRGRCVRHYRFYRPPRAQQLPFFKVAKRHGECSWFLSDMSIIFENFFSRILIE